MKLTRYRYSGPRSASSLRIGDQVLDVVLVPGKLCELPAEHDYVQTLLALKHLTVEPTETVRPVSHDTSTTDKVEKKGGKA